MKSKICLGLLLVSSAVLNAVVVEVPTAWVDTFTTLSTAIDGISLTFDSAGEYYTGLRNNARSTKNSLNARDARRRKFVACVRAKFEALNSELATCNADTTALAAKISTDIQGLTEELAALQLQTTTEITNLTVQRDQLLIDLTDLQNIYDTAVGDNGDKAVLLLEDLRKISKSYDVMINKKAKLCEEIDELMTRIREHDSLTDLETREIKTEICG